MPRLRRIDPTRDGLSYAYAYLRVESADLYLVKGVMWWRGTSQSGQRRTRYGT